jgi:hypothetical protein
MREPAGLVTVLRLAQAVAPDRRFENAQEAPIARTFGTPSAAIM